MNIHPDKPYSPACERNRDPILAALRPHFADRRRVLEIGSGTGQHAVHFAAALPHLVWQTSDRPEWLPGIRLWLAEAGLPNTPPPIELDVRGPWPAERFDAIFSANTPAAASPARATPPSTPASRPTTRNAASATSRPSTPSPGASASRWPKTSRCLPTTAA